MPPPSPLPPPPLSPSPLPPPPVDQVCSCRRVQVSGAESIQGDRMGVYEWTDETIQSRPVYHGGNGSQFLFFAYNGAWMIDTNRHGIAGEVGAHDSSTCPTNVETRHWVAKNGTHWSNGVSSNGTHQVTEFSLNVMCAPYSTEPPTHPPSSPSICSHSCTYSNDGDCDDGGPGADYALCDLGSDCADCGLRPIQQPSPAAPPPTPLVHSEISVTNDAYNGEVSWALTCDGLSAPITGGAPHLDGTTWSAPLGSCTLHLSDSYGDGWQGATWTAPGWTDQSYSLASGSNDTVSFFVSYQSPSPPPLPRPPPQPPPQPLAPSFPSEINVTNDVYNSEVTWRLTCDGLSTPITGGAPHSEMYAVPSGRCTLILMDGYGDGWQGATWTAPGWTEQSYTLAQGSGSNVTFYVGPLPPNVLTTNGATCWASLEITSLAACSQAIAAANAAIGVAGSGTVSSESYSFTPKGCYSSCYLDSTGYFCGYFNTHATGSGTGTDSGNNRYLHCLSNALLVPHPACNTECGAPGWSGTGAGAAQGRCHNCWTTVLLGNCPSGTDHVYDGWTSDDCCNEHSCTGVAPPAPTSSPPPSSPPVCNPGCPSYGIGDNYCDSSCNVPECNYDEGDCNANPLPLPPPPPPSPSPPPPLPPPPLPPSAPTLSTAYFSVVGPCAIDGACVRSPNYPSNYGSSQSCTIMPTSLAVGQLLSATAFNTESGYDTLIVNGVTYSGTTGPSDVLLGSAFTWSSV